MLFVIGKPTNYENFYHYPITLVFAEILNHFVEFRQLREPLDIKILINCTLFLYSQDKNSSVEPTLKNENVDIESKPATLRLRFTIANNRYTLYQKPDKEIGKVSELNKLTQFLSGQLDELITLGEANNKQHKNIDPNLKELYELLHEDKKKYSGAERGAMLAKHINIIFRN